MQPSSHVLPTFGFISSRGCGGLRGERSRMLSRKWWTRRRRGGGREEDGDGYDRFYLPSRDDFQPIDTQGLCSFLYSASPPSPSPLVSASSFRTCDFLAFLRLNSSPQPSPLFLYLSKTCFKCLFSGVLLQNKRRWSTLSRGSTLSRVLFGG